ncbi:hypothetical protein SUGI_0352130 [Cryptomeria japonica]|uniref:beta-D-glucosyl crocetin beta-1,6-glucosyltransferase n=1 Tax=Cryptomeria japonica TaxID=3369 RepID=UPI002408B1FB|nr:beta-D-glucosyl crocetin beta-1,6-glucosyltransferase [Cryptomeria japonica]GLJ19497.1 hypothetical protein SUGI_0352130 [Cryptomeria japonica]
MEEEGYQNSGNEPLHVLMFPWLAHGHISAYAELSIRLAQKGTKVSFFSTPLNIAKIKPLFASRQVPQIQLLQLPLPKVAGLPPEIESTSDLPMHLTPLFNKAVDGLEAPFEKLLAEICPDCVIFDFVQWWAGRAAAKFGAASVTFSTLGAAFISWAMHPFWRLYGNGLTAEDLIQQPSDYPSRAVTLRLFEAAGALVVNGAHEPDAVSYPERCLRGIDACDIVAVKTCAELEGKYVEYFGKVTGKPVVPLGPLLSPHVSEGKADSDVMTWLDKQSMGSVVYVSFGSQCFLSREEIAEVALGLEASGQPFLWALHSLSSWLPEGFVERLGKRGIVVRGWVPQREVLAHLGVGSLMTHCGWNSIMEGLSNGLVLIASPMQLDQSHNARLIVLELNVGNEVGRGKDGTFEREEICKAVRMVMGDEGREMRAKAKEIGHMFKNKILKDGGSQDEYMTHFVDHLHLLKPSVRLQKGKEIQH